MPKQKKTHKPRQYSSKHDSLYSAALYVGVDGSRKLARSTKLFAHCGDCARHKAEQVLPKIDTSVGVSLLYVIRKAKP